MSMNSVMTDGRVWIHVIVPVYNCETYIVEAVASVLNQPYRNVRIVLVDDGSTDASPEICDRICKTQENITVIHKKNGGVSSARNAGIDYVLKYAPEELSGQYIAFLDADDAWEPEFLDGKSLEQLDEGFDLLGFQSCTCNIGMQKRGSIRLLQEGVLSGGTKNVWAHSSQSFAAMLYSCKLLKKYNIRFQEGLKYSEDKIFSLQCMYLADRIWQENRQMYLYRTLGSSAMGRRPFGIPYYRPIIDAYLEMDREMAQWATPERGVLMVGRICASRYIVYMLQEHFQQWRGKKEMDNLLREHPGYVAIVKREPPFGYMPRNPEFEVYEASPVKYIWKHRMLGIKLALRRCAGRIIKRFFVK